MARASSIWECQQCGFQSPKWSGKCPDCGTWNSLVETLPSIDAPSLSSIPISDVKPQDWRTFQSQSAHLYLPTGISELDRVLGGGLVKGGVILIAGEPGIGKSTLLSQLALKNDTVFYVNGEESSLQVAARLKRLASGSKKNVMLFPQTNVEAVIAHIAALKRPLVIVDSIQVMFSTKLRSAAGSVGQIRESAARLIDIAKRKDISTIFVGHFTKEGEVAGPKVLEHMVDTVLVMEGERSGNVRMVRSLKNRFGPVDEVGLFAMEDGGMREVTNPAELLIGEHAGRASGSVLGCVLEGQRPLVLEVQALTVPSKLSVPRRVGQGVNERRLQLLCAVIERHLGLGIGEKDVFVNVAGGMTSADPGLDLAVVAAIVSSASEAKSSKRKALSKSNMASAYSLHASRFTLSPIFCGEVGLLGEVRAVQGWERREKEVKRLGLGTLVGKPKLTHIKQLLELLRTCFKSHASLSFLRKQESIPDHVRDKL